MADGRIVIDVDVKNGDLKSLNNELDQVEGKVNKAGSGLKSMALAGLAIKTVSAAIGILSSSMGDAITRFDQLNQFPKVLTAMGASAEDAARATQTLKDGIEGLPTRLQDVTAITQQMYSVFKDADLAAESTIALNNALLASGSSGDKAAQGTEQYMNILRTGKVEMDS